MPSPKLLILSVFMVALGLVGGSGCAPVDTTATGNANEPATSKHPEQATRTNNTKKHQGKQQAKARKAVASGHAGTALGLLSTLAVKGRAPMTGYDRGRFGAAWADADRNGCDTRSDILGIYLNNKRYRPGTRHCIVESGTLVGPYTGKRISYVRGDTSSIDIDHVVALGNAWVTGAWRWGVRKRAAIANDPLNLLPVDYATNRQKGAGDAATWLPPVKSYRCSYVARQVTVKAKYGLWVTPAEKAAIGRVLGTCPQQAPIADRWKAPVRVTIKVTDSTRPRGPSGSVYFHNCTEARAAGAAPVHRGEPGYSPHLDGDGDGVGCE